VERQSPIFTRLYDLILWLLNHTESFPKSERFRLARRLDDAALDLYEQLTRAVRSASPRPDLLEADRQLAMLRFYLRLSHARHLTNPAQYEHAAGLLTEIGRLLGGWIKKQPASSDLSAHPGA